MAESWSVQETQRFTGKDYRPTNGRQVFEIYSNLDFMRLEDAVKHFNEDETSGVNIVLSHTIDGIRVTIARKYYATEAEILERRALLKSMEGRPEVKLEVNHG